METELRKYEHTLVISGVGVIAFGLWSIIKAVLYLILVPVDDLKVLQSTDEVIAMRDLGLTDRQIAYFFVAVVLFVLVADFALRLYIGRSAFADGRRIRNKRLTYVIWAIIVSAGLIATIVSRIVTLGAGEDNIWRNVTAAGNVSIIVDMTSLFALVEMIIAAFIVRKLRRELGMTETGDE